MLIISHQRNAHQTIIRYHFIPIKIAILNKSNDNTLWQICGEIRTLIPCCWKYRIFQPLQKTIWQSFEKLNIELAHDSAILLVGIYS